MSTPAQRIEVFQDTMDWIKSDSVLSASISVAKKKTTVFYEDDYPAFESSKTKDTIISVSGDRSFQAAMRLRKENPGAKIAVMNFANENLISLVSNLPGGYQGAGYLHRWGYWNCNR